MIEHNLLLVPYTENEEIIETINAKGKTEHIVKLKLTYKWINADNPQEVLEVPFFAVGQQDDVSKAHGTALTYAERYFLMKFFNIPTDEDDADAKQKQEKYNKVSSQTVGVLKQEVLNFVDLMKSLNKEVSQQQAEQTFGIQDYTSMSEQQAVNTITKIQNMANKYKEAKQMINRFIGVGRLTKDPEFRTTPNGVSVTTFTIAVNRTFTNAQGEREADFINCVTFRKQADNVNKF